MAVATLLLSNNSRQQDAVAHLRLQSKQSMAVAKLRLLNNQSLSGSWPHPVCQHQPTEHDQRAAGDGGGATTFFRN